jgi:hypothetical protein
MPESAGRETKRYLSLLGLVAYGDIGGITCYRNKRGRIVQFAKTFPKTVPTLAQLTGRARMSFAAEQWRHFSAANKEPWKAVVRINGLRMTGYNLWIRWYFRPYPETFKSDQRHAGVICLNYITRTQTEIPARRTIEPHELEDEQQHGRVRYGRPLTTMPYLTTEWIPYAPIHHGLPDGDPVTAVITPIGPGTVEYDQPQNNHWSTLAFTSPDHDAITALHIQCLWPDQTHAATLTFVQTLAWPP